MNRKHPINIFTAVLLCLLLPLASCVGSRGNSTAHLVSGNDDYQAADEIDTECSYFYFLWGRTSEIQGKYEEALEAYEKAVVCDDQAEYVIRHIAAVLLRMNRKEQALAWAEKLIKARPNELSSKIFQADIYHSIGDDKAAAQYQEILKLDPDNLEVLLKIGKLYLDSLDYAQARLIFERLLKLDTESFVGNYYLAKIYRELKLYQKSFAAYQQTLDLSWSAPLAMELADFFESQELFDEAIELYRKILQEDDSYGAATRRLIKVYLEVEQSDKALALLQELRNTAPDSRKVDLTIGRIFMEQKKYDQAISLFTEMLKSDPAQESAHSLLALAYYESGDTKRAKSLLLSVRKGDAGYDEALFMLVKMYSDEKDFERAANLVKRAIAEDPAIKENYYFILASIYEEQKKLTEADQVFKDAVSKYPESSDVYFKYGMFLERNNRLDEAMVQMEKMLDLNPNDPYALNYVGYSWAEKNINLVQALEYIKKAVLILPEDGFVRDSLGWVYFRLGEGELAAKELRKALEFEAEDPTIHEHLGDVYAAMHKGEIALKHYEKSLELIVKDDARSRIRAKIARIKAESAE